MLILCQFHIFWSSVGEVVAVFLARSEKLCDFGRHFTVLGLSAFITAALHLSFRTHIFSSIILCKLVCFHC